MTSGGIARFTTAGLSSPIGLRLYFDSYIYDLITKRNEARQTRKWLKANSHQVPVSINANVVEALRIADPAERAARLKTIVTIGTGLHPPYDYLHYREIAVELVRLRPQWFRPSLDRRMAMVYLRRRKREWPLIKSGHADLSRLGEENARIYDAVGRDLQRQRIHRREHDADWSPRHSDSQVQNCIDARTRADAHWRYVSSQESAVTIAAELRDGRHLEWLRGLIWPQPAAEWDRFWMCDVDADSVPLSRIIGLTEYFQRQRKVTPGNAIDRLGHAPHLYGFDQLLTTDRMFYEVLQDVRTEMRDAALARPILIDSDAASALAAIQDSIR